MVCRNLPPGPEAPGGKPASLLARTSRDANFCERAAPAYENRHGQWAPTAALDTAQFPGLQGETEDQGGTRQKQAARQRFWHVVPPRPKASPARGWTGPQEP